MIKFESKLSRTAVRGYDVFIRSNFHEGLPGDSVFAQRKTLDARWAALSPAEKQVYNNAAESENEEESKYDGENFPDFQQRMQRSIESSKKKKLQDS